MKQFFTLFLLAVSTSFFAQTAPDFTITTSDGQVKSLYDDYLSQGENLVIEVFFTTCPPCNTHAPFWQALYQSQLAAHPGQVEFLMLSILQSDNNNKVALYKTNKNLTMPGAGSDGGALAALAPYTEEMDFGSFQGTPTFILINTSGQVTYDIRGANPQATMDLIAQNISAALDEPCSIRTPFDNPISDVQLSATTSDSLTVNLNVSGTYSLSSIPQLQNTSYTISATKADDNVLQGVTTFDLVLISKHILGLDTFTAPWQFVAADMNCTGAVTTYDIVIGRQLILGYLNNGPCGSWRFLSQEPAQQSDGACIDLTGVKLGDITGPYFAPPPNERSPFLLRGVDRFLQPGERFSWQLQAQDWLELQALQLELAFDPAALIIHGVAAPGLPGFDASCYRINPEGRVPLLWVDASGAALQANAPLLSIELTAQKAGHLSEMLALQPEHLPAEVYTTDSRKWNVDLQWQERETKPTPVTLYPNPARERFQLRYTSLQTSDAVLQLQDVHGKIVLEKMFPVVEGENLLDIRCENVPGLYFVKLDGQAVGKIVIGY